MDRDLQVKGCLAVYPARYEPDLGAEYAQFPSKEYTDTYRTGVLFYALSEDGKTFEALNGNKAVMSPEGCYKLCSPSLFRKMDGTYGLIAAVGNASDQVILYDSEDLLYFKNQRVLTLNHRAIAVKNPIVRPEGSLYKIFWEGGDGKAYVTVTENFVVFSQCTEAVCKREPVNALLPEYAVKNEAFLFGLTSEEYDRINRKYGKLRSVSVEKNDIAVSAGEEVRLPEKVNVVYSDGSKTPMGVVWDLGGVDFKNLSPGEYRITGTIRATAAYRRPLARFRADPYVVYDDDKGLYYFTGSNMNENSAAGGGAYQSIVIRQADTIDGIADAEEHEIWTDRVLEDGTRVSGWYWAPEIHKLGGKWRMIALASVMEPGADRPVGRQCIFTCNGNEVTEPGNWEYTGYIHNAANNEPVGAFDTTCFEYGGKSYYVTPRNSGIWITEFDPGNPLYPTGPLVQLSSADRAFESNIGSGKAGYGNLKGGVTGQAIQEAPSVLMHDGKIFIAYAGCTVDMMYCVCILYADLDSDLTDPGSWQKYPYPILATQDLTTTLKKADYSAADGTGCVTGHGDSGLPREKEGIYAGTFGPGHNSFTVDENGNPVMIYHARDWDDSYPGAVGKEKYGLVDPGRHAYAAPVIFNYEGFPVCNLKPEEYLAEHLKKISVSVVVRE